MSGRRKAEPSLFADLEEAATALSACGLIGQAGMLRRWSKHLREELSYDGKAADVVRKSTSNYETYRGDNMRETLAELTRVLCGEAARP